jgi:hypothetical protein
MTAAELIADIFSRPQERMPETMRRITGDQLRYLRGLIALESPSRIQYGRGRILTWTSRDNQKWLLTEDMFGKKHSLTRLANLEGEGQASLF